MSLPTFPVEWLILVPVAVALGFELYFSLFLLGLLSLLPGAPPVPSSLGALGSWPVLGVAGVLTLVGWATRMRSATRLAWAIHTLVSAPVVAALLAFLLFGEETGWTRTGAGAVAFFLAAGFQMARIGWRTLADHFLAIPRLPGVRWVPPTLLAAVLILLGLESPTLGASLAALVLVGSMLHVPSVFRAARFTFRLLAGQLSALVGPTGWRDSTRLPRWIVHTLTAAGPMQRVNARGTPAALKGASGAGLVRDGWLVAGQPGLLFLYRTPARIWELELEGGVVKGVEESDESVLLELDVGGEPIRLAVPRGGPGVEALTAEFG